MLSVDDVLVDLPANVAYQELDLTDEFVRQFHRYIPNIYYSSDADVHTDRFASVVSCFYDTFCHAHSSSIVDICPCTLL